MIKFLPSLCILVGLAILSGAASAAELEEGLEPEVELFFAPDEITSEEVESASLSRQSLYWSPSAISVFTREDIRSAGVQKLTDLLRRVPGFDIYELKTTFPLVGARALTNSANNLVLMLVDGREEIIELTGFPLWNTTAFDLEEIERIEVIRGPGSALYGANAFAAVVSITTLADHPTSRTEVSLNAGEDGQLRLLGLLREHWKLGGGWLSLGASLGAEELNSPSDPADPQMRAPRAHGTLRFRDESMDLSLHVAATGGQAMNFYHMGDMRLTEALNHWSMLKSEFRLGENSRLHAQVYHNRYRTVYVYRATLRAYDTWIADVPDFPVDTSSFDGQVRIDHSFGEELQLVAGANLRYSYLVAEHIIPHDGNETRGAGFFQFQWNPWQKLQITGGLRLDLNSKTQQAVSPRLVAVFGPVPEHTLRLGFGLAFRKPAMFESQVHFEIEKFNPAMHEIVDMAATQFGNESLVNQKVRSFEAGWRGRFLDGQLQCFVDAFFNLYQDSIFFEVDIRERMGAPDINNSVFRFENQAFDIIGLGGEAEIAWQPGPAWTLRGSAAVRWVADPNASKRMSTEPILRLGLAARYLPESGWIADLSLHAVSAYQMPLIDPGNLLAKPDMMDLGGNALAFLRLGYRLEFDRRHLLETGITARLPVGLPFREYAGIEYSRGLGGGRYSSDFGGELVGRRVALYVRASF